jgi:hypothetical protein
MYAKLGYGWGNSLLGFLALVIGVPFPIFIFRVLQISTFLQLTLPVRCPIEAKGLWRSEGHMMDALVKGFRMIFVCSY